jgi:GNAT superfamily N-acetyltransferase
MLTYQVEPWDDLWPDLAPIWEQEHRLELGPHPRLREREVDHQLYAAWQAQGILHCCTARAAGQLVGYYVSVVHPFANATGVLAAAVSLYYVRPAWRQQGVGRALLAYMEQGMRTAGVALLLSVTKWEGPHLAFLERLGFAANEIVCTKWIGKE